MQKNEAICIERVKNGFIVFPRNLNAKDEEGRRVFQSLWRGNDLPGLVTFIEQHFDEPKAEEL